MRFKQFFCDILRYFGLGVFIYLPKKCPWVSIPKLLISMRLSLVICAQLIFRSAIYTTQPTISAFNFSISFFDTYIAKFCMYIEVASSINFNFPLVQTSNVLSCSSFSVSTPALSHSESIIYSYSILYSRLNPNHIQSSSLQYYPL